MSQRDPEQFRNSPVQMLMFLPPTPVSRGSHLSGVALWIADTQTSQPNPTSSGLSGINPQPFLALTKLGPKGWSEEWGTGLKMKEGNLLLEKITGSWTTHSCPPSLHPHRSHLQKISSKKERKKEKKERKKPHSSARPFSKQENSSFET